MNAIHLLERERDVTRARLEHIEIAIGVFTSLNGAAKLATFDRAIVNGHGKSNGKVKKKMGRPRNVDRAAAESNGHGDPPGITVDGSTLATLMAAGVEPDVLKRITDTVAPLTVLANTNTLRRRTRALVLLKAMHAAGVTPTDDIYTAIYRDVLHWGSRPLVQQKRFGSVKLTKRNGWQLTPMGEQQLTEAEASAD